MEQRSIDLPGRSAIGADCGIRLGDVRNVARPNFNLPFSVVVAFTSLPGTALPAGSIFGTKGAVGATYAPASTVLWSQMGSAGGADPAWTAFEGGLEATATPVAMTAAATTAALRMNRRILAMIPPSRPGNEPRGDALGRRAGARFNRLFALHLRLTRYHRSMDVSAYSNRWYIGDIAVTSVIEQSFDWSSPSFLFPNATNETVQRHSWLAPDYADSEGNINGSVQALVIDQAERRILVDPCVGSGRTRFLPSWHMQEFDFMDRFAAAGFAPSSVDLVLHTHLHADHVGWDTYLEDDVWTPTFPNARYLYVRDELEWHKESGDPDRRGCGGTPYRRFSKPVWPMSSSATTTSAAGFPWRRRRGTREDTCRFGSLRAGRWAW